MKMGWTCKGCKEPVLSGSAPCPKCGKEGPTTALAKGWRISEGKCRNSGMVTIYIRDPLGPRFQTSKSANEVTDQWYKNARRDGKLICDLMNAHEAKKK